MFSSLAVTTPYLALAGVVVVPVPVMLFTGVVGVVTAGVVGVVTAGVVGVVTVPLPAGVEVLSDAIDTLLKSSSEV